MSPAGWAKPDHSIDWEALLGSCSKLSLLRHSAGRSLVEGMDLPWPAASCLLVRASGELAFRSRRFNMQPMLAYGDCSGSLQGRTLRWLPSCLSC